MEIIIKLTENNQLVSINDAQFIYQKLENELGEYFDIKGEISFNDDGNSIFKFDTQTLIADIFLLFYSINDYFEFGSVSLPLNCNSIDLSYQKQGNKIIFMNYHYNERDFLIDILHKSYSFFNELNIKHPNDENKMYLNIINMLKKTIKNRSLT